MARNFDVTFKLLFRHSRGVLSHLLFGEVAEWLNVELPRVSKLNADSIVRCKDGSLRQVEFQITNDRFMPARMLEYYISAYRLFGEHVQQIVLYAGREPLTMPSFFESASTRHEFTMFNLREMDGNDLLKSDDWMDNEFALLTKIDRERVIRVVLDKLRKLSGDEQQTVASTFVILGGIIGMEDELRGRLSSDMINLLDNKVFGPVIRQSLEQAEQEGMARMLRILLERRFGRLPPWAAAKLASASAETLDTWGLRLDESSALEEILS